MNTIQGTGMYQDEQVTIIGSHKDKLLVVASHNPIQAIWVKYTEVDSITWVIGDNYAA